MAARSTEPMSQEPIWSMGVSICLIAFGLAGIVLPHPLGIGVATLLSWVLLFAGISHLVIRWKTSKAGAALGRIFIGLAYVAGAAYLFADPDPSIDAMTRLFGVILFAEGVALLTMYFRNKDRTAAIWVLIDGIATIVFAGLIWTRGPDGTLWTVGAILSSNIVFSGIAALMISLTTRPAPRHRAPHSKSDVARGATRH